MNLQPTVRGRLAAKHQYLELRMGETELLRCISTDWKRTPTRAVIQLPPSYRAVALSRRSGEAVALEAPREGNAYAIPLAKLSSVRLYCVADSLGDLLDGNDTSPLLPLDVSVAVGDDRVIPARTAIAFCYRAEIRSHEAFAKAFANTPSLDADGLCEQLKTCIFAACGDLVTTLSRQTLTFDASCDCLRVTLSTEPCEREINARLAQKGLSLIALSMALAKPFDREDSGEWSAYLSELSAVREMQSDAKLMKIFQENQRLAAPIRQAVDTNDDCQEPQRFDTLI